ncbi:MAG: peptide deformylase [Muribaculaceae bacterium]|nr:peptide deformylase [Muribaculaceae bacterium]MDE6553601.1 peptide deformylase [Muribaculaceae bacterium]MDE7349723.1 peptide deformylase [Muribaculaceae bacterium]
MLLPIYLYGHPVLRAETEEITPEYPDLKKLIADMWETMYNSEGVGLAAPQIGRSIRLIVLDGSVLAEDFPECKDSKMVLINPELDVIEDMEPVSRAEGCLSIPGLSENVKRVEHVRLNWLDEDFVEHEKEFTGFLSRIIQHEYDHLEGQVYTDHISPIRKQLVRSKLGNIAKGKVRCDYRTKSAAK